jgi:hypothetical protein
MTREMRTRLGDRIQIIGTFERFGTKRGFKGPVETVLLLDIRDDQGLFVQPARSNVVLR